MIYRHMESCVYYAGIDYFSRNEDCRYGYITKSEREDTFRYDDFRDNTRLIHKGVDLAKGISLRGGAFASLTNWQWITEDYTYHEEAYPDDL